MVPLKIARMNAASYVNLRKVSSDKFSMQKFIKLKELAMNMVGENNDILTSQLHRRMALYNQSVIEVNPLEQQIIALIEDINPPSLTILGIGALSAAVIYAEYGDLSKFYSPSQMLSFAVLEPGYYQSGTSENGGHMVKHGPSHLCFTLMSLCITLI